MTDINIEDLIGDAVRPLNKAEIARAATLSAAIEVFTAELKGYKERAGKTLDKGMHLVDGITVTIGQRVDKDLDATAAKFPVEEYPDRYKSVLDTDAIAPKDFIKKPAIPVVSFKG